MPSSRRTTHSPRGFPTLTLLIALLAIAAWLWPALGDAFALDRRAVAAGQLWRILTGHLAHFNAEHLLWDVFPFTILGVMAERRSRRAFIACMIAAALVISLCLAVAEPTLTTYRGLSGINSALLVMVAVRLLLDARRRRDTRKATLAAAALVAFIAKLSFELLTARTLFVTTAADFVPVPAAHLIGAAAGLTIALAASLSTRTVMNDQRACVTRSSTSSAVTNVWDSKR